MADVGSLGQYKVVVTADYSQLQSQFKAMTTFINDSTKQITENLNKSMGAINATMIAQLQTSVNSLKRAFDGLDDTTKKGGDGFKSYASQIREAEKAAQKCHQEITALQNKMAGSSTVNNADLTKLDQLKAKFRELYEQRKQLKQAQADYNNHLKLTDNLESLGAKAKKQAYQEDIKALREQAKARQDEQNRAAKQEQTASAQRQRELNRLTTQYKVAYEEINKYLQSHTKMSEAVFIRLQGRITAFGNEIRRLGSIPPMPNPLEGMDFDKYASGFSRLGDAIQSFRHHLTWMASAVAIGTLVGLPVAISEATKEFEALNTKIMQNLELADQYRGNHAALTADVQKLGQVAQNYAKGFGMSVNEVQEAIQIISRRFKDVNTATYLTGVALKMSRLDFVDTAKSARDLESVLLQFGMGARDAGNFLNDFSVLLHNLAVVDFLCILQSPFYCDRPCLHNTLYTRNFYCRIYISGLHISRILLGYFFLLDTPLSVLHYTLAELKPAYVYGLCTPLPLLFLLPCIRIIFSAFVRCLILSFHILSAFCISGQILCGTCIPTSCVLNYLYQVSLQLDSSFCFFIDGWRTIFILSKGGYFFYS